MCHRFRMATADQFPQLFNSRRRHVHHQQDLACVDVLLERLQPRVRHRHRDEARSPGAEDRADDGADQHRDKLQCDSFGRSQIDVDADQEPPQAADHEPELGAVHGVRLLKGVRLVQLAQGHPSLGEEMHVPIFDPREQQIVGRLDGAAQIGQQEVHSASHARSPLRNTTRRPFLPRGTPEVKPPVSRCGKIAAEAGQTVAGKCFTCQRKVRAPQSRVLGNAQAPRGDEQGHRDES